MAEESAATLRPIEIGLIIAGELDECGVDAIWQVKQKLNSQFSTEFPGFDWIVEFIWRTELTSAKVRVEPMILVDLAREERDSRDWDYVFVITPADLITYYEPFAFAAVSRSMDSAVISTLRIDPRMEDPAVEPSVRTQSLADRLVCLMRKAFGQINSLEATGESGDVMSKVSTIADVDSLKGAPWSQKQQETLAGNLELIADLRLEEVPTGTKKGPVSFYFRSAWWNRHEILDAVVSARPWEFPVRLNRLSTAALSSSLILIVTAESWELAVRQSFFALAGLVIMSIVATTGYITTRQQLLVRRERRMSEQSVITNVTAVIVVVLGMLTTYALTFALLLGVTSSLFHADLVKHWTALDEISWPHYAIVPGIVASFAVIVGALGASFEEQHYFRHIIFVDEEI